MNSPDPRLMRLFNTEEVYRQKLAGRSLESRMLMALLSKHHTTNEMKEEEALRQEAERMSEDLRASQALYMSQVQEKLHHTHAPMILAARPGFGMMSGSDVPVGMDEGMVRMASAAGRMLAHIDLNSLEKDAGIFSTGANVVKNISSGVGKGLANRWGKIDKGITNFGFRTQDAIAKGVGKIDKGITGTLTRANDAISNTFNRAKAAPGNLKQRVENWGANVGQKAEHAIGGTTPPPVAKAPVNTGAPSSSYRQPAPSAQGGSPSMPAAKPSASSEPVGGASQAQAAPPAAQPAQPTAPAKPGFLQRAGLAGKDGSLDLGKLRNTAIGLGAAAGVGYLGYRGAKGLANVMNQEHEPDTYNEYGPSPAKGVNEFGVPQRNTPFIG